MKLWRIPWRWDYHGIGAIFVIATTASAAIKKAKADANLSEYWTVDEDNYRMREEPDWANIKEMEKGLGQAYGCDD